MAAVIGLLGEDSDMIDIMRLRARRFDALYELLVGRRRTQLRSNHGMPDDLSRDLGLTQDAPSERSITQKGIMLPPTNR